MKKTKKYFKKVVILSSLILLGVIIFSFATSAIVSHFNYKHNLVIESTFSE